MPTTVSALSTFPRFFNRTYTRFLLHAVRRVGNTNMRADVVRGRGRGVRKAADFGYATGAPDRGELDCRPTAEPHLPDWRQAWIGRCRRRAELGRPAWRMLRTAGRQRGGQNDNVSDADRRHSSDERRRVHQRLQRDAERQTGCCFGRPSGVCEGQRKRGIREGRGGSTSIPIDSPFRVIFYQGVVCRIGGFGRFHRY